MKLASALLTLAGLALAQDKPAAVEKPKPEVVEGNMTEAHWARLQFDTVELKTIKEKHEQQKATEGRAAAAELKEIKTRHDDQAEKEQQPYILNSNAIVQEECKNLGVPEESIAKKECSVDLNTGKVKWTKPIPKPPAPEAVKK